MNTDIFDLRSALEFLQCHGEVVTRHNDLISTEYEIARHYAQNSAGVPASAISREEQMVMYTHADGHDIPVLMGLFGSRKRNQLMLTGAVGQHHHKLFAQALAKRIPPVKIADPACQQVVIDQDINLAKQLPVLTLTPQDAGPYITMGFVLARDSVTGEVNGSIHRLCIQGEAELTISIYPGRHLGAMYEAALSRGETLPLSVNIGLDPAIYFASCLTDPVCKKGESELDVVGGLRQKAVAVSDCVKVAADCISGAEIVIEGELTAECIAENFANPDSGSMPEFLGYQGSIQPGSTVPVIKVRAITHRENPIYQSVIGPGLEQSELQAITPELATLGFLKANFDLDVKDVLYNTSGGGLLMSVLQVAKHSSDDDSLAREAAARVLALVPPLKHLFLVDEDVNIHSPEDLLWALTTRFQADCDLHKMTTDKPFMMDPSQTPEYRSLVSALANFPKGRDTDDEPPAGDSAAAHYSTKALFDCTVPWAMKGRFERPFL